MFKLLFKIQLDRANDRILIGMSHHVHSQDILQPDTEFKSSQCARASLDHAFEILVDHFSKEVSFPHAKLTLLTTKSSDNFEQVFDLKDALSVVVVAYKASTIFNLAFPGSVPADELANMSRDVEALFSLAMEDRQTANARASKRICHQYPEAFPIEPSANNQSTLARKSEIESVATTLATEDILPPVAATSTIAADNSMNFGAGDWSSILSFGRNPPSTLKVNSPNVDSIRKDFRMLARMLEEQPMKEVPEFKIKMLKKAKKDLEKTCDGFFDEQSMAELSHNLKFVCAMLKEQLSANSAIKIELQDAFVKRCKELRSQSAQLLSQGKPCREVLDYIAQERRKLAFSLYHYPPENFGMSRVLSGEQRDMITPVTLAMPKHYHQKILEAVPEGAKDFNTLNPSFSIDQLLLKHVDAVSIRAQEIGNTVLTRYLVMRKPIKENTPLDMFFGPEFPCTALLHMPPQDIEKVMNHVFAKANVFLKEELSKEDRIEFLAQIASRMAHAMPWARGSASILEIFIEALAEVKGLSLTLDVLKQQQKSLDMEILTTPDNKEVIAKFAKLVV